MADLEMSDRWKETVGKAALVAKKTLEEVTEALLAVIDAADDEGLATLANPKFVSDEVLRAAFASFSLKEGTLNRFIAELRGPEPTAQSLFGIPVRSDGQGASISDLAATLSVGGAGLLPQALDDDGLLNACRVGGIAKVDGPTVAAGIRVFFADQLGIFGIEKNLVDRIDERATGIEEPWPQIIYDLRKQLLRRRHGDMLEALGVGGDVISKSAQDKLLQRLRETPSILHGFQESLAAWWNQWQSKMSNPGAIVQGIAAVMQGGVVSRTIMAAPDTAPVVDAASHIVDQFNRVFAGPGIPVAKAMAQDAIRLADVIKNPDLRTAVGATTHEEMVKTLGIGVSAEQIRIQQSLTVYVLAVYDIAGQKISVPQQLVAYLDELYQLGEQIKWERLLSGNAPSNGRPAAARPNPKGGSSAFPGTDDEARRRY